MTTLSGFPVGITPCFLIGTAKAATTSLAAALAQHPHIAVSEPKECMYYSSYYGSKDYSSYFNFSSQSCVFVDASTHYSFPCRSSFQTIPQRIKSDWPSAKIIYVLRDYADRLASLKKQLYFMGTIRRSSIKNLLYNNYFFGSFMYQTIAGEYVRNFGSDSLLLLSFEDLTTDTNAVLQKISNFLGLPSIAHLSMPALNVSAAKGKAPAAFLSYVHESIVKLGVYDIIPSSLRFAIKNALSFDVNQSQLEGLCGVTLSELEMLLSAIDAQQPTTLDLKLFTSLRQDLLFRINTLRSKV